MHAQDCLARIGGVFVVLGLILAACGTGQKRPPPQDGGATDVPTPPPDVPGDTLSDTSPDDGIILDITDLPHADVDQPPADGIADGALEVGVDSQAQGPVDPAQPGAPPSKEISPVGAGLSAHDVALYFAPIWYQDTAAGGPDDQGARADVPLRVHYDGDLEHRNNWDHLPDHPLPAHLYYGLVATASHYFITYMHYHARDWEPVCVGILTACHEGDLEDVQLVVERDETGFGHVVLVRAHHHGQNTYWTNDPVTVTGGIAGQIDFESLEGAVSATQDTDHSHLRVFAQSGGHGLAPCWAANNTIPPYGMPKVQCPDGSDQGFGGGDGIRYVPGEGPPPNYAPEMETDGEAVPYALEGVFPTLWAWRHEVGSGLLYRESDVFHYVGARKGAFQTSGPIGVTLDAQQFLNDTSGGHAPWNHKEFGSEKGDIFLDPAYAYAILLGVTSLDWSMTYTVHPYLPDALL